MMRYAKITGTGMCVPDQVITNHDLAKLMDTSDEWIRQRSGIVERRWIEEGESPSSLAEGAARQALEDAGLSVSDIDCILLSTLSAEHEFPGTSFFLHERLDAGEIPCIDLRAQCSGFLYGLSVANAQVRSGQFDRVGEQFGRGIPHYRTWFGSRTKTGRPSPRIVSPARARREARSSGTGLT